ncbi:MAG: cytochrome c [Acidobacteriaceae bacterium]|nr:cytochrome c [Acidobacteriaceae bacterium]
MSLLVAVVACVALAAPLFSGCRTAPSLTAQESEGKQLYLSRCAHCHEENDLQLKRVPPDLHSLFAGATMPSGTPVSDAAVRAVVLHGKGMMPIFDGRFTDEQMAALLAYLRTGLR